MAAQKEDTDPSTPASRRPQPLSLKPAPSPGDRGQERKPLERLAREASPAEPAAKWSARPKTDPGLGPGSRSPPSSTPRPPGVVVPPPYGRGPTAVTPSVGVTHAAAVPGSASLPGHPDLNKDSVELLLDGMTGPRPDRTRTTPQSAGEASASYHAKHGVHPAHTLSEPGPKVVIARASTTPPRGGRSLAPSSLSSSPADTTQPTRMVREDATTMVPPRVGRRVAMAILVALLVVLALFVVLDFSAGRTASLQAATAQPAAVPAARPVLAPAASAEVNAPVAAAVAVPAEASAEPAVAPTDSAVAEADPAEAHPTKPHHRAHPGGAAGDLGEFKPKF
jgi:hypothetical protein